MKVTDFIQRYVDESETMGAHDRLFIRLDEHTILDATVFVHRRWLDLADKRSAAFKDDPFFEEGYLRALGRLHELVSMGVLTR